MKVPSTVFYLVEKGKAVIGENSDRCLYGNNRIKTHAEMDAYKKLEIMIKSKKIKNNKMDLIVLRVNKVGDLCESAPCLHCTNYLASKDLISIDKLYYSTSSGSIVSIKFNEWKNNGPNHISKGWRWCINRKKKN